MEQRPRGRGSTAFEKGWALLACLWLCGVGHALVPPHAVAGEPPQETPDCQLSEIRDEAGVVSGVTVGRFSFATGPATTRALQPGHGWEQAVQTLVARYVEVCRRYEAGVMAEAEFDERLREIAELHGEAQALEARLLEAAKSRAMTAEAGPLDTAVRDWVNKVGALEPLEGLRGWLPPEPVKPGATTGTVGAAPDRPEDKP